MAAKSYFQKDDCMRWLLFFITIPGCSYTVHQLKDIKYELKLRKCTFKMYFFYYRFSCNYCVLISKDLNIWQLVTQ